MINLRAQHRSGYVDVRCVFSAVKSFLLLPSFRGLCIAASKLFCASQTSCTAENIDELAESIIHRDSFLLAPCCKLTINGITGSVEIFALCASYTSGY